MTSSLPSMFQLWRVFDGSVNCSEYLTEDNLYSHDQTLESLLGVLNIDPKGLNEKSKLARDMVYDFLSMACCSGIKTIEDLKAKFDLTRDDIQSIFDVVESVTETVPRYVSGLNGPYQLTRPSTDDIKVILTLHQ